MGPWRARTHACSQTPRRPTVWLSTMAGGFNTLGCEKPSACYGVRAQPGRLRTANKNHELLSVPPSSQLDWMHIWVAR